MEMEAHPARHEPDQAPAVALACCAANVFAILWRKRRGPEREAMELGLLKENRRRGARVRRQRNFTGDHDLELKEELGVGEEGRQRSSTGGCNLELKEDDGDGRC